MEQKEYMQKCIDRAKDTSSKNLGGPFGACVVKNGEIISLSSNSVLQDKDPTAHAEINAIRGACKKLNTYDLADCELYTTAYPCPMCLSAIIWANIKTVYYGCTAKDANDIGFRDDFIYDFIKNDCKEKKTAVLNQLDREDCLKLFEEYVKNNKTIY